ncbi:dolichol-phosphate mannosyltransferase [Streptomyces sp. SAI-208]|jgi:dolichol-phosphate mannosyltransferase|uniref:polyprenol monophosphomannose synthase n=1 Tax=unclassified Streptomyces TaxID=2593676 RepID=UPI002476391F|nr:MULTISPECIES: polyprenol monophosphomannose synthase [unclassified Streptomyces]MDH6517106.1 dolichol-phosphate mannosyltransferase [Streptomyces sp. SAI-090]MDH6549321.1 dolichol-phosphate mannosyltransferase [Streptomyces sp. SAI-041]MDH6568385.1 dolichol-phosphate mannosyltransferase [Streptomyces sp. SAI-117]MDH6586666.1 dolichol-phosphate mannosyltransferase [Streptomyces sp. SAI-133]MDH6607925.1 dolichol-phosphate mannosyltransferase [Streptomyces sp. SAI-208]
MTYDLGADVAVTVVMPTYNEAANLPRMAEAVLQLPLDGLHLKIVDDSSPDGTGRIAEELAEKYNWDGRRRMSVLHRTEKDGLGRAYVAGMSAALDEGAAYVVQMDADGSHPVEAVPRMLGTALASGVGLVVGSRYVEGGSLDEEWGKHRVLLSRFANRYARTVLGTKIRDITAGFNLWSAATLRDIDLATLDSAGYSFQVELKFKAVRAGHSAVEIPIRFEERTEGVSKMNLSTQIESAVMPVRLRLRNRRG